jgi:two-component system, LytTR family, sensor kinase
MEKIVEFILRAYPLEEVSLKRKVGIHAIFWFILSIVWFVSVVGGVSFFYRLWASLNTVVATMLVYYFLIYLILPNVFSVNKIWKAIIYMMCFYFLYWFQAYLSLLLLIKFDIFPKGGIGPFLQYANKFVQRGFSGVFNYPEIFRSLASSLLETTPAFFMKLSRIMAVYSQRLIRSEREKTKFELDFLRAQLNPHFLLNTLNNIYSQIVNKDDKASDSVSALSVLLNYTLYDSAKDLVLLKKEILFIRDYLDLEKLRAGDKVNINFELEGSPKELQIAPLILISFIENAFKHGVGDTTIASRIDIDIVIQERIEDTTVLIFKIVNTKPKAVSNSTIMKQGGIGLENTRKRLNLLYPDSHKLTIKNGSHNFTVELMIILLKSEDNVIT